MLLSKIKTVSNQNAIKNIDIPMSKAPAVIATKKKSIQKELSRSEQMQLELNDYVLGFCKNTDDIPKAITLSKKANICIQNKNFVFWAKNQAKNFNNFFASLCEKGKEEEEA